MAEITTVDVALWLAGQGMHVFDVDHPELPKCAGPRTSGHDPDSCTERGKHPACKWSQAATTDPDRVRAMFIGNPRNIGISCGPSGLLVVDEDADGELARYAASVGAYIPVTLTVRTGKGRHYYFRQPDGRQLGNSEGALRGYAVNIRGRGGYVVGPGSRHANGDMYVPEDPNAKPAPCPDWLLQALDGNDQFLEPDLGKPPLHGDHTGRIAKGKRDNTLWDCAARLRLGGDEWADAEQRLYRCWQLCDQPAGDEFTWQAARDKLVRAFEKLTPHAAPPGNNPMSTPGEAPPGEPKGITWRPVDLGPILSGEHKPAEPTIGLARQDGVKLLYPGKEHAIIGLMECGKSWLACAHAAAELTADNCVIYVHFEEGDPADTVARLQALGVPNDAIAERFCFVAPNERADPATIAAELVALNPSLVILDGVNEAMAMHGMKIYDPDGAALYRALLVKPFTATGAAVVSLDHLPHHDDGTRRSPLGSIHKGNGLTGSLILLENTEPFGRDRKGASYVYITKDRPAFLRRHGQPDERTTGKTFLGTLVVDDTREHHKYLDLRFVEPDEDDSEFAQPAGSRPKGRPDRNEQDDQHVLEVVAKLAANDPPASLRKVRAMASIGKDRVEASITRLLFSKRLDEQPGPRKSRQFTVAGTVAE